MQLKLLSTDGEEKGAVKLPSIFEEKLRADIIKRAVDSISSNARQPYGAMDGAGMGYSAKISRQRHDYKGSYGHGISRVPRKILTKSGTRFNWVGAFVPGTVGGRRSHPPKACKIFSKKINVQENKFAIRSAIAATVAKNLISSRGHILPEKFPFAIQDSIESITKTKDLVAIFEKLGFGKEMQRTDINKIRAGVGKSRGRRYVRKTGLLLVLSKNTPVINAINNIPGFQAVAVNNLNASLLAPGSVPGRLTLFTQAALNRLEKESLFSGIQVAEKKEVKQPAEQKKEKKQAPKAKA
jgi:large subunit ribosomal protein L4e